LIRVGFEVIGGCARAIGGAFFRVVRVRRVFVRGLLGLSERIVGDV
jgi:hypothetical protein